MPLWLVLILVLAVRIAVTWEHSRTPLFIARRIDERAYDDWAKRVAGGRLFLDFASNHAPGYPWVLGAAYRVVGDNPLTPRLLHMGLALGCCGLVYLVTKQLAGGKEALVSTAVYGFYWPPIVFEQRILAVSLFVFLTLAFLLLAVQAAVSKAAWAWALAGLVLGLSALVRPSSLAWLVALFCWLVLQMTWRRDWRWGRAAVTFLAAAALPLAPVLLKNHAISGAWSLVQMDSALNLYIGNNPQADGTPYARPGGTWNDIEALPVKEAGITNLAQQERFYVKKVRRFLRDDPAAFMGLLIKKTLLLLNNREIRATIDPEFHRALFKTLALPLPGFALILGLALPGLLVLQRSRPDHQVLLMYLSVYAVVLVGTVISSRYRLPLAAGLAVLTGPGLFRITAALSQFRQENRSQDNVRFTRALLPPILCLGGIIVGFLPVGPRYGVEEEVVYLGDSWEDVKDRERAAAYYQQALALSPDYANALMGIGRLYADVGEFREAIGWLQKAANADPHNAHAHYLLGVNYYRLDELEQARREFLLAVEARPQWGAGLERLADLEIEMGRTDDARRHLQAALEVAPANDSLRARLQER